MKQMVTQALKKLPSGILGDMGVALTRFRCGQIGLIFREKPTQDHGIDGEIEILSQGTPTGRLISTQIKCGPSYLSETDQTGYVFRFEAKHYDYWVNHSLPVIGVLVDHEAEICFWGLISPESVENTGKGYKISIPKSQTISVGFLKHLTDLATPAIPRSTYQVFNEEDKSTGVARRVSRYVSVNAGPNLWTKPRIRTLLSKMTFEARTSGYYRSDITANTHKNRMADVVWVYVYRSENDRNLGAYIARSMWIDPSLKPEYRPMGFEGEVDSSGLIIDWNKDFDNIISFIDNHRSSKADFVRYAKSILKETAVIIAKFHSQASIDGTSLDFSEFMDLHTKFANERAEEIFPPHECERLGDRIAKLIALLDNAKIFAERICIEKSRTDIVQFQRYTKDAYDKSRDADYELRQIN